MSLAGKKVAVTGASGLVGGAFWRMAAGQGATVLRLVRDREHDGPESVFWDYSNGELDTGRLAGCDAVVHLAGETIAGLRWTQAKMQRIESSREESTRFLARRLLAMDSPPPVFICASATGFYGNTGDSLIDESAPAGDTFLAGVCRKWEEACEPLRQRGVRVVNLRIGMVLSLDGGGLPAMLPAFRKGLGGPLGDGGHWTAWIEAGDLANLISFCISNPNISGPVNAVTPNPLTNKTFTSTLGRVLGRPAVIPVPEFLLRAVMGRLADEVLLASCRALPSRLLKQGFNFAHPELEEALGYILSSSRID
jgi:uncharacterized protein (TIGR01777 family)